MSFSYKLKSIKVKPENLYLDPNNPRFIEERERVPESRFMEEAVQRNTLGKLEAIGIEDLIESISKYGFLTIDRVIVKPLDKDGNYLVLEGNRRIAALKRVKELHQEGEITLGDQVLKSLLEIEVLVFNGDIEDIVWTIQGLRHLTGIKEWPKLQQAKFITENFYERKKMKFREIARMLNLKPSEVSTLIRSYYAFIQAKNDEEYGDDITSKKFSIFSEGVFKKPSLKDWLGWNDRKMKFTNDENFKNFLRWIAEEKVKRAIDVRDVISKLVLSANKDILESFNNDEIDLEAVRVQIAKREMEEENKQPQDMDLILRRLNEILVELEKLPFVSAILNLDSKKSLKAVEDLEKLFDKLKLLLDMKLADLQGLKKELKKK